MHFNHIDEVFITYDIGTKGSFKTHKNTQIKEIVINSNVTQAKYRYKIIKDI